MQLVINQHITRTKNLRPFKILACTVNGYDRIYDGYNKHEKSFRIKAKEIDAVIGRVGSNLAFG